MPDTLPCPLCAAAGASPFYRDSRREYLRCSECALVFVPPLYYLDRAAERREYELHENHPGDAGYRRFLSRLAIPLLERLPEGASGLDFGCGPGPALAMMLEEGGCRMRLYDSFFRPEQDALAGQYDFITATEVVEHLHRPGEELSRLWSLLRPGGLLGVMTKLVIDAEAFSRWHYKNDPTHVAFFSADTWAWWAASQGGQVDQLAADALIIAKP